MAARDGFVERILSSALATYDIFSIYIGDRLGLYAALQEEPSTPKCSPIGPAPTNAT